MRNFRGLVFLLVLAAVLFVGPVIRVEAADGEQVANELSGWVVAVAYVAALLGIGLLAAVGVSVFPEIKQRLKQALVKADSDAFWNTVPGRTINDTLKQALPYVDEPTDPLIQRIEATKLLNQLRKWGIISGEDFSKYSAALVADGIKLTNGVPDVEFTLLNFDSTLGGSERAKAEALRLATEPSGMGQFPNG
jgi:hypothetical protein